MWDILDAQSLFLIYALSFLIPFAFSYFVFRLVGFWRGL